MGAGEPCDEVILESLDGSLSWVLAVVVRGNELKVDLLPLEVQL